MTRSSSNCSLAVWLPAEDTFEEVLNGLPRICTQRTPTRQRIRKQTAAPYAPPRLVPYTPTGQGIPVPLVAPPVRLQNRLKKLRVQVSPPSDVHTPRDQGIPRPEAAPDAPPRLCPSTPTGSGIPKPEEAPDAPLKPGTQLRAEQPDSPTQPNVQDVQKQPDGPMACNEPPYSPFV